MVNSLFVVVCDGFVIGPCFVMQYLLSFLFCNNLAEEERAGCFTFIAFLLPCGCYCSLSLPHSAVVRSAVCDCSIFLSYSLILRFSLCKSIARTLKKIRTSKGDYLVKQ